MLGDRNHEPPGYPGEMTIDELRIWDAMMNETDVWNIYAGDVFHWMFVNHVQTFGSENWLCLYRRVLTKQLGIDPILSNRIRAIYNHM